MFRRRHRIPEDLERIGALLEESRPELPEERLQQLAAGARMRARRSAQMEHARVTQRKEPFLRSRLAIGAMLVAGFALSGAGAGMAVSGPAADGSPAGAVYQQPDQGETPLAPEQPGGGVLPEGPSGEEPTPPEQPSGEQPRGGEDKHPEQGVANEESAPPPVVQETRQLGAEAGGSELPVTGWAAIPVLLLGLGLLAGGLLLNRSRRTSS